MRHNKQSLLAATNNKRIPLTKKQSTLIFQVLLSASNRVNKQIRREQKEREQ